MSDEVTMTETRSLIVRAEGFLKKQMEVSEKIHEAQKDMVATVYNLDKIPDATAIQVKSEVAKTIEKGQADFLEGLSQKIVPLTDALERAKNNMAQIARWKVKHLSIALLFSFLGSIGAVYVCFKYFPHTVYNSTRVEHLDNLHTSGFVKVDKKPIVETRKKRK